MIYGIEDQGRIAGRQTALQSIASSQAITLNRKLPIPSTRTQPQVGQYITFEAARRFNKTITLTSTQAVTLTPTTVPTPIKFSPGEIRASARFLQPGNLQLGPVSRVNWKHPLADGLVFLEMFDQLRTGASDLPFMPALIGAHGALTVITATTLSKAGPGGVGLSMGSTTGGLRVTSGNLVKVPQIKGSYFAYVTADFAPNDGGRHYITSIGRETGGSEKNFALLKFTDSNTYFGWLINGVGFRAVVASTGLWAPGDTFMYGGTWNASSVNCFIKGKLAGSSGAPTTGDTTTATASYRVGNSFGGSDAWGNTGKNYIYYVAMWNRDLSTAECNYLNQNPYCFMTTGARP